MVLRLDENKLWLLGCVRRSGGCKVVVEEVVVVRLCAKKL